MLQYRYAKGVDNSTYDILSMDESKRRLGSPYRCFGCDSELIANLPKTNRTKHFSHKSHQDCSKETYLHLLAKAFFFEQYSEALTQNQPFIFVYKRATVCNAFEQDFSLKCESEEHVNFDLTRHYKKIEIEKKLGAFIPDISLISDRHPPLFIEMSVTHKSSEEKAMSGEKIIEIQIDTELDIHAFQEKKLREYSHNVRTYGIAGEPREGNICQRDCEKVLDFFAVYKNGKARILNHSVKHFFATRSMYKVLAPAISSESGSHHSKDAFLENLRHHLFKGEQIKNCLLCVHECKDKNFSSWCRIHEKKVTPDTAIDCDIYKPFKNVDEAEDSYSRNLKEFKRQQNVMAEKMLQGYPKRR